MIIAAIPNQVAPCNSSWCLTDRPAVQWEEGQAEPVYLSADVEGLTPLHSAAYYGRETSVKVRRNTRVMRNIAYLMNE